MAFSGNQLTGMAGYALPGQKQTFQPKSTPFIEEFLFTLQIVEALAFSLSIAQENNFTLELL